MSSPYHLSQLKEIHVRTTAHAVGATITITVRTIAYTVALARETTCEQGTSQTSWEKKTPLHIFDELFLNATCKTKKTLNRDL